MVSEHILYRFALPAHGHSWCAPRHLFVGLDAYLSHDDDPTNGSDFVRGCLPFSSPRPAAPGEPSRPSPPFAAPGRLPLPTDITHPA